MGHRHYDHIYFRECSLPIQASSYHYCTPRKTMDIKYYEGFEVGIVSDEGFLNVSDAPLFDNYDRREEWGQFEYHGPYGYVPAELIESMYNYLKRLEE